MSTGSLRRVLNSLIQARVDETAPKAKFFSNVAAIPENLFACDPAEAAGNWGMLGGFEKRLVEPVAYLKSNVREPHGVT